MSGDEGYEEVASHSKVRHKVRCRLWNKIPKNAIIGRQAYVQYARRVRRQRPSAGSKSMLRLTIMCPVYNEEVTVPLFFARLYPVIDQLRSRYQIDLLFLNNASSDGTLAEIKKIRQSWPNTYVIALTRNVGYQASLECGLRHAEGDLFLFIDVDCEDPPELILEFVAKFEQGYDIVYGERVDREEPRLIIAVRKLFYRILQAVADEEIILDMAEFALFTDEVRKAIVIENSSFPFIRASIARAGFNRAAIPYKRQRRITGQTHYNLIGMVVFAVAGILSASTLLLRLPFYLLPLWLIALSALGIAYLQTSSLTWALAGFLVFAAYVGCCVSFIALYVARTYKNGLQRPNAFIDHRKSMLQLDVTNPSGQESSVRAVAAKGTWS